MVYRMDRARLVVAATMLALVLAGIAGLVGPQPTRAAAAFVGPKSYYLALGDSLAFGYQPNLDWSHGYADDWFALLRPLGTRSYTNLGCPGETSSTFINGGCPYAALRHTWYTGSQLTAAVNFIHAHPAQVSPVSLDIGANDMLTDVNSSSCVVSSTWDADLQRLDANLTQIILPQLTAALTVSGARTGDLALMNYYNPYQNKCGNSLPYISELNAHLAADAAQFNLPVADVYTAFGGSNSPICTYTWMCTGYSDFHPSGGRYGEPGNGYVVIANAFQAATYAAPPSPTTGAVTGQVVDASTNAAITGATVTLGGQITTTDGSGSYTFSQVPYNNGASQTVSASAVGYGGGNTSVIVVPGQTVTAAVIQLTPATGTVAGTVTDTSNNPIAGATVTIGAQSMTTGPNGSYTLSGVTPGTGLTVTASAGGYVSASQSPITVTAGGTTTVDFSLTPAPGTVNGTVIDASTNTAITGATVTIGALSVSTDGSGHYSITNVPPGSQTVTASAGGYVSASQSPITVTAGGTTTVDFSLTPAPGTVTGQVVDVSTNTAIAGATVTLGGQTTTTDGSGSYTFSQVPYNNGASQTVSASAVGYGGGNTSVIVVPGQTVTAAVIQLTPATGTVAGTVTDTSNNPIAGATVTIGALSAATDGSGHFSIANVPTGTQTVAVTAAGFTGQSQTVPVLANSTATVNFTLAPSSTGSVVGTVTVQRRAMFGVTMTLSGNGVLFTTSTDSNGYYQFTNVPAGTYSVQAWAFSGKFQATQTVIVSSGGTTTLNFAL